MNVMHRVALRQMLSQKRRTAITILGVIVAVAMIAAVSSFSASFMALFQRISIANDGEWHAKIYNTTAEDRALIAAQPEVQAVFVVGRLGNAPLLERQGFYSNAEIYSLDAAGMDAMQIQLLQGEMPGAENDALITESFASVAGMQPGDILETEQGNYRVCGIASMGPLENNAYGAGETPILLRQSDATRDEATEAWVRLRHPDRSIDSWVQALCEEILGDQNFSMNTELLMYMGISNKSIMMTIWLMAGIVLLIIMAAAVTLIYNAFAISVTDRTAQFGLLSSIGATMRQRRKAVLFEALVIAAVAIPLGLVFGYLGIGITFSVVSGLLNHTMTAGTAYMELKLVVEPGALALAVGLALIMVLLSAWIPSRRAARVSPMEAIRKTQDIKLNGRKVKTSRLTRLLFGFEGELAMKNLKRNKKRYRITTLSLAMSLVLFLSAYSFTQYMTGSYGLAQTEVDYNVSLDAHLIRDGQGEPVDYTTLDALQNEALAVPYADQATVYTTFAGTDFCVAPGSVQPTAALDALMAKEEYRIGVNIRAMDDEALAVYAQAVGADLDALMDPEHPGAILVNSLRLLKNQKIQTVPLLTIAQGDTLHVLQDDAEDQAFRLAAVTADYPPSQDSLLISPRVTLIVSQRVLRTLYPGLSPYLSIFYTTSQANQLTQALEGVLALHATTRTVLDAEEYNQRMAEDTLVYGSVYNYDKVMQSSRDTLTIINIFVYGFITLLSMVAAANIVGTISTSLMLRKREFAMLKSVGMGQRAFKRMIRCESIFYGLKAIALGLAGSIGVIYLIWRATQTSFSMAFQLPLPQMGIGVAGIFALVAATMAYSTHKLRRDTILEDLRLE